MTESTREQVEAHSWHASALEDALDGFDGEGYSLVCMLQAATLSDLLHQVGVEGVSNLREQVWDTVHAVMGMELQ